jgi:F-box interacting protein
MNRSDKTRNPAADLTDDLVVEILSRLPVKSVCRFKCVSRNWLGLITHRANRKKLPQSLSGFFRGSTVLLDDVLTVPDFVSILEAEEQPVSDPSLSFLPGYRTIVPKDCCNGLLFCFCWKVSPRDELDYVVCNPATQKWRILPLYDRRSQVYVSRLVFDPAVSSHFHMLSILEDVEGYITGVEIYSSEAGAWSYIENGWGDDVLLYDRSVFLNGMLHFVSFDATIVAVDREGKSWRNIPLLETMVAENIWNLNAAFIDQSQGQLHYLNVRERDASTLSVWIMEDYQSDEWNFKYNISTSQLFGCKGLINGGQYTWIAIHPECSLIFYIMYGGNVLMSYDMIHGEVRPVCNLRQKYYGSSNSYLPYVPWFMESLADHDQI